MKKLNVKIKVPYGYYHVGEEFEEIEFDVDDIVFEMAKSLMADGSQLSENTLPELASEHSELSGLHEMIIARGFERYMNWKLSFGIEFAKRDEMLHFCIEEDIEAGLFKPSSKYDAENEYIDWIMRQPYEFSCRKFDVDIEQCEKERDLITYTIC